MNHYVSSFAEAVKWWARRGMEPAPKEIADYYTAVILPAGRKDEK